MLYIQVTSQQFFSHIRMFSCCPGLNQHKAEDKVSCSVETHEQLLIKFILKGGGGEDRGACGWPGCLHCLGMVHIHYNLSPSMLF